MVSVRRRLPYRTATGLRADVIAVRVVVAVRVVIAVLTVVAVRRGSWSPAPTPLRTGPVQMPPGKPRSHSPPRMTAKPTPRTAVATRVRPRRLSTMAVPESTSATP